LVTVNSIILAMIAGNDATMKNVQPVASAGSFTLHANAAETTGCRDEACGDHLSARSNGRDGPREHGQAGKQDAGVSGAAIPLTAIQKKTTRPT
jgi:hypothetical protein